MPCPAQPPDIGAHKARWPQRQPVDQRSRPAPLMMALGTLGLMVLVRLHGAIPADEATSLEGLK